MDKIRFDKIVENRATQLIYEAVDVIVNKIIDLAKAHESTYGVSFTEHSHYSDRKDNLKLSSVGRAFMARCIGVHVTKDNENIQAAFTDSIEKLLLKGFDEFQKAMLAPQVEDKKDAQP